MAEQRNIPRRERLREQALYRYSAALERSDLDAVAAVLREAEDDPVLEADILELNAVYAAEDDATAHEQDATVVRDLLRKHLPGAMEKDEPIELPPLTVGTVAARVQSDAARGAVRADAEVLATSRQLSADLTPLPDDLNASAVRQLFRRLGLQVSDRFRRLFRETAIYLTMGREQGTARMAATRRQQARRTERPSDEGSTKDG